MCKKMLMKLLVFGMMAFFLIGASGCTRIPPGYVGIKVNMLGSDRGVDSATSATGFVMYMPWMTQIFEYPTFVQVATWTASEKDGRKGHNDEIVFNTREGLVFKIDVSFAYNLSPDTIPAFYVKFRSDRLDEFTHIYLRNIARDAFVEMGAGYTAEEIYGNKKEEFLKRVLTRVNSQLTLKDKDGKDAAYARIEQFGIIGDIRMPEQVRQAIEGKIAAIQNAIMVENQVRQAKAEAQKAIAKAEGEAKANQVLAQSITPTLLEWRRLTITEQTVWKWNGQRPMVEGSGAGLGLLMQLPNKQ